MPIKVFDFFSGCGGTSQGLRAAGCSVVLGVDNDPDAAATFRSNFPEAAFFAGDIRNLTVGQLIEFIPQSGDDYLLFSGCAPCQPFSKQNRNKPVKDERVPLLAEFGRLVAAFWPELIFVENVPGLQSASQEKGPFADFLRLLKRLGYRVSYRVVLSQDYGVPQRRRRLVLIASSLGTIPFPSATHGPGTATPYSTVWDYIADLPSIQAGEEHPGVLNHRAAMLSEMNAKRIASTPVGGGRLDWRSELRLPCHTQRGHDGHTDVYGRMKKYEPASALTTRCVSLSNGRYGHPEQDRAISVREAACLQTFPRDFGFKGNLGSMARQIGNAVPVLLAERFGDAYIAHVNAHATRGLVR